MYRSSLPKSSPLRVTEEPILADSNGVRDVPVGTGEVAEWAGGEGTFGDSPHAPDFSSSRFFHMMCLRKWARRSRASSRKPLVLANCSLSYITFLPNRQHRSVVPGLIRTKVMSRRKLPRGRGPG